jgi:hypothetical protein
MKQRDFITATNNTAWVPAAVISGTTLTIYLP